MAIHYQDILDYLERSRLPFQDEVADPLPISSLKSDIKLRQYQQEALEAWFDAGKRGVIELPTGAGKTYIALKALENLNVSTLIVVPTLDLLDQWRRQLEVLFDSEVGVVGGGEVELKPVTVSH
jgi:superfamily II DNA or RNA helicase